MATGLKEDLQASGSRCGDGNNSTASSISSSSGKSNEDLLCRCEANDSYASGNDSLELTPAKIGKIMASKEDLKGFQMSDWNDQRAHVIYRAFNVKRFKVDEEHILFPLGGHTVGEILESSQFRKDDEKGDDQVRPTYASWSKFEPRMKRIMKVFRDDSHLLVESLVDDEAYRDAKMSLTKEINYLAADPPNDTLLRQEEKLFHDSILSLLDEIKRHHQYHKNLSESSLGAFIESLIFRFNNLSLVGIRTANSTLRDIRAPAMAYFGTVPKPDLYLYNAGDNILAVLEMKTGNKLRHNGHRTKSCKDRQKSKLTGGVSDKELEHALMSIDQKEEGKECEDCKEVDLLCKNNEELNDTFDEQECLIEKAQKDILPDHIMHLDAVEKKQSRCFLPQLLGQMLVCTFMRDKCATVLQEPFMTQILGLGFIGLQVQFVMLVLKDLDRKIDTPTVEDMRRTMSVRPYVYVTRKLNLFRKEHLEIFFRTLFALCNLQNMRRL